MNPTPYITPLVGLFFLIFGLTFVIRSRNRKATAVTQSTHRKLGITYTAVGLILLVIGLVRLAI